MFKTIATSAAALESQTFSQHNALSDAVASGRGLYAVIKHVHKQNMLKCVVQVQVLDDNDRIVYRFGSI